MKRSKFSLSNYKLFSCDMGELIPIGWFEALPGDTIQHATSALVRAAPMLAPPMHPVHCRIHHWFVPYRLIWDEWEDFITGGPAGTSMPVPPYHDYSGSPGFPVAPGSLLDYLGVPTITYGATPSGQFSSLPTRAYQLIWNEFYRDQDLQTEIVISKASGHDGTNTATLQNVCWEKDYFTSARPWEQKGPVVTVPIGTSATVRTSSTELITGAAPVLQVRGSAAGAVPASKSLGTGATGQVRYNDTAPGANPQDLYPSNLYADLANASAQTVNVLRQAFALQRWEEARARWGSRYTEYLRAIGVRSSDARLQRPEYLGGGKQTLQFSEVLQTGPGTDPVGSLKGHGIGAMRSNRYRRFMEEHGIVMSLMSVRPKTMYQNGLHRSFIKTTKEDYWQRELQHIGQQKVYNREIYAASSTPVGTFGYQDRYDEYRRAESTVAGEFRNTILNYWHFARDFASAPALNASFVSCVPTERVFASSSTDVLYIMASHSIQARRMVAKMGTSFIF